MAGKRDGVILAGMMDVWFQRAARVMAAWQARGGLADAARRADRWLIFWPGVACWALWLFAQLARDIHWVTGLLFYIPTPLFALILAGLTARAWHRGDQARGMLLLLLTFLPVLFVVCVESNLLRGARLPARKTALRLVHWNVFEVKSGWGRILASVGPLDADLYVFSDVSKPLAKGLFDADYTIVRIPNMAILARGRMETPRPLAATGSLLVYTMPWYIDGQVLTVFAVDLASDPELARPPRLRRLAELIATFQPDLVVGDFNAPRRSRHLTPPPAGYVHAYDAAGGGWSYTWPAPFPTLAIDQCLLGPRLRPQVYCLRTSPWSDHRQQILDFAVGDKP